MLELMNRQLTVIGESGSESIMKTNNSNKNHGE